MSKHITDDQVREIHESLLGTSDTLDGGIREVCGDDYDQSDLSLDQVGEIDNHIFNCTTCGWWYEVNECNDDDGDSECDGCYGL